MHNQETLTGFWAEGLELPPVVCPGREAMDGPSARAVGQTGEPREPDAGGRTSGG